MTNFNQKRAEKPFFKGSSNSCHETVNHEGETEFVKKVTESINENTPIAEQQKGVEMKDTKSWLEDEVKENNERQESPCWSKISIIDKFYSNKENPPLSSKSSPDVSNKEEIGSVATDENKNT